MDRRTEILIKTRKWLDKYFNLEMPKISELLLLQLEVILDKKYGRYYVQFLM